MITFDLKPRVRFGHAVLITLSRVFYCVVLLKKYEYC